MVCITIGQLSLKCTAIVDHWRAVTGCNLLLEGLEGCNRVLKVCNMVLEGCIRVKKGCKRVKQGVGGVFKGVGWSDLDDFFGSPP